MNNTNTEVIGSLWKVVRWTISTKIKMGISRLFDQFGLSSGRDYHMEDEWITEADSVHIEESNNVDLMT